MSTPDVTTPGGLLLVLAVLVPFVGMLLGLVAGGRHVRRIAFGAMLIGSGVAVGIATIWRRAGGLVYLLGDWSPPLGIALRADGPAVAMLLAVAFVVCGIGLYARADFGTPEGSRESRSAFTYWLLLLAVWGSLNLVFVSGDLFTLYVALELLTFAGVPLVCLTGSADTLRAALRYLLFALCGSVLYLLGAVLLYGGYGTLDMRLLADVVEGEPITWTALALMTVGLLAKTALFPLHMWLPPAHGGAPPAASAVLSALVIKGSWFLVLRLWCDVMPGVAGTSAPQLLGALGAAAIVVGSLVALRQRRLKLLVAYSTVAQIGYLFLMFPMAVTDSGVNDAAVSAGVLQAISHATAKAGMFMAAGLVYTALGHDRIDDLAGAARALPITLLAFFIGGVSLMGVLPSGAYLAKKLLLDAADASGQWWWIWVLQLGAVFTAGYMVLVMVRVVRRPAQSLTGLKPVSRLSQLAALGLSLASVALALTAVLGPLPASLISNPLSPKDLAYTLAVLGGGTMLAWGLARRPLFATGSSLRSGTQVLARAIERGDHLIRRWPAAMMALLGLAAMFSWLLGHARALI